MTPKEILHDKFEKIDGYYHVWLRAMRDKLNPIDRPVNGKGIDECKFGHKYTPESMKIKSVNGRDSRYCLICSKRRALESRTREKLELLDGEYEVLKQSPRQKYLKQRREYVRKSKERV